MAPAIFLLAFSAVFQMVYDTKGEATFSRSDVRELLRNQNEPSSWSTRVRRKGSSEELEPPFWANRGRSESGEEQPPFWGNRGRSYESRESEFKLLPQMKRPFRNKQRYDFPSSGLKLSSSEEANLKDILRWLSENKRQRLASFCESINNYPMHVDEPLYFLTNTRGAGLVDRDMDDHYLKSRGRREMDETNWPANQQLLSRLSSNLNKEFSLFDGYEMQPKQNENIDSESKPLRLGVIHNPPSPPGNMDDTKYWNPLAIKKLDNRVSLLANNTSESSFMK